MTAAKLRKKGLPGKICKLRAKTKLMIQLVSTDKAPAPAGHYSQATVHNGLIYVAGQLPITADRVKHTDKSIAEQARIVLDNIQAILQAAGSDKSQLLQVTVYITDVEYWGEVNAVYTEFMEDHRPARAIVPVGTLHYGLQIEMQAIAAIPA